MCISPIGAVPEHGTDKSARDSSPLIPASWRQRPCWSRGGAYASAQLRSCGSSCAGEMGRGCCLIKQRRTSKCLCVAEGWPLLGFMWQGKWYYERVFPFGMRSSCRLCAVKDGLPSRVSVSSLRRLSLQRLPLPLCRYLALPRPLFLASLRDPLAASSWFSTASPPVVTHRRLFVLFLLRSSCWTTLLRIQFNMSTKNEWQIRLNSCWSTRELSSASCRLFPSSKLRLLLLSLHTRSTSLHLPLPSHRIPMHAEIDQPTDSAHAWTTLDYSLRG